MGNEARISLLSKFDWVAISTSVINSAIYFAEIGYYVDIYAEQPNEKFELPKFNNAKINWIITEYNDKYFFDDLRFLYLHRKQLNESELIICFDAPALIRGGLLGLLFTHKIVYHSLEFSEFNLQKFSGKIKNMLERFFAKRAHAVLTQSKHRAAVLISKLGIKQERVHLVYNSPIGEIIECSYNYFRSKFDISPSKTIILSVGSLIREHCVLQLLDVVQSLDDRFVIVFHGWLPDKEIEAKILSKIEEFPSRVFLSNELFPNEDKYIPYCSADIGFVGFLPLNDNLKYSAGSAGKLHDFMRVGRPVLGYDTPGMRELVVENGIGETISDFSEINKKLTLIMQNYDLYAQRSHCVFMEYEFRKAYALFMDSAALLN